MKKHSTNTKKETKEEILRRLAERRKNGKLNSLTIGAKLVKLKEEGKISQEEFDRVMGVKKNDK